MRTAFIALLIIGCARLALAEPSAKQLYESGSRKFDLGQFEEAAQDFQAAYQITGDPALLFNTAQAYRQARNFSKALFFYKTYMASYARKGMEPPNKEETEQRIAEAMEKLGPGATMPETPPVPKPAPAQEAPPPKPEQLAPQTAKAPPPAPVADAPPATTTSAPPEHQAPRWMRPTGIALVAVGVAGLAVGGAMAGLAVSDSNQISSGHGEFTSMLADVEQSGKRYQTAEIASFAVGGALAVAGVVTLVLSFRHLHAAKLAWAQP